jgi:hypothetical protein
MRAKAWVGWALLVAGSTALAQAGGTAHAPDGGVRQQLQSITIPPLQNAPFTAIVTTEWTHLLPDGTSATVKNHRLVARDSAGRVFEERRYFTPDGDKKQTMLTALQFLDPSRHEYYDCVPNQRSCTVRTDGRTALAAMPAGMTGEKSCSCGGPMAGFKIEHEALGQNTIEDVEVIVSREIATIAEGQIGNQKAEPIVKEFWYSPRLGVNLVVKRFDPRSGIQNFDVNHISLGEPNPKLFAPPEDYQVVRMVVEKQASPQSR